jgi:hypothetical protein
MCCGPSEWRIRIRWTRRAFHTPSSNSCMRSTTRVRKTSNLKSLRAYENAFWSEHELVQYLRRYRMTYKGWNKGVFLEEALNARFTVECVPLPVDVVACFFNSCSIFVIVLSKLHEAIRAITQGSECVNVFFLDGAPQAWTTPHVTDCRNQDPAFWS